MIITLVLASKTEALDKNEADQVLYFVGSKTQNLRWFYRSPSFR